MVVTKTLMMMLQDILLPLYLHHPTVRKRLIKSPCKYSGQVRVKAQAYA